MIPISPIILTAQIAPPTGGGSLGLADTTLLENPFQTPMWLDEVRFRIPGTDGTGWSNYRVELKLGEVPITKGFVPISLFGKVLSYSSVTGEAAGNAGNSPQIFTWKLPKPLFIPAKELLRPTIYFEPFSGSTAQTITVIYCCRPLPKGTLPPKTLQVPWVTSYQTSFSALATPSDIIDQTTPSDLYNPFNQDLHIQRFVGRLMMRGNDSDGAGLMALASANVSTTTGLITVGTLVSAQDSFNNILIRDRTPFAHVFSHVDRAWTVNCVLPPKGFYLFNIERLWSAYIQSGTHVGSVGIGMIGYREVPNRV